MDNGRAVTVVTPEQCAGSGRWRETLERLLAIPPEGLRETLDAVADIIADVFSADKVDAWLHRPGADDLVLAGLSDTLLGRQEVALGLDRLGLRDVEPLVEVFRTGRPYLTGHADADLEVHPVMREQLGIRSIMCQRLEVDGEWRGVLLVCSTQAECWSELDLDFLGIVARWVGRVTHRTELEQRARLLDQERQARAEAEDAVRARDEFVSIAAHELRNPVATIRAAAQLLQRTRSRPQIDPARLDHYIDVIAASAERLSRLVDDLLDVSRLRGGQLRLRRQPADVAELLRAAAEVTAALPETAAHGVSLEADECEPCLAEIDPDRIEQILSNLLHNAVKYSPRGGDVRARLRRHDLDGRPGFLATIEDQGIGIPPDQIETIFDPFGRASNAAEWNIPGLGLGLYVSRRIAEAHGGRLWAASAGQGHGTTLYLWLPLADRAASPG